MLDRLKAFAEEVDIEELQKKVKLNWKFTKKHAERVNKNAMEIHEKTKSNRILPWVENSARKLTNDINIAIENSRVRVMNV